MKVQFRKLSDLKKDPANARIHSEEQIKQIANSIRRFGFTMPAAVDEVIRAGNGRYDAAALIYAAGERIYLAPGKERGGKVIPHGTMPCFDCSGWSEEEKTAYALADNKLALNATWDESRLAEQLQALKAMNFELPVLGFNIEELKTLLSRDKGKTDPDATPDLPDNAAALPGDLWLLGPHRLKCGDATSAEDVESVLDGDVPHLMVTDPPYGVDYDPSWRDRELDTWKQPRSTGKVNNDNRADWGDAWKLFPGDVVYVWHAGNKASVVEDSLTRHGFLVRAQLIWRKQNHVIGRGDYHPQHEPCWYCVRKGRPGRYVGGRKQSTIWDIKNSSSVGGGDADDKRTGHGTQKPIECMKRPIENNSKAGDMVYEPFSGSGTTIIACQMTGRICRALELNPLYIDVAIQRWQEFTGQEATLAATGKTYAAVKAERLQAVAA